MSPAISKSVDNSVNTKQTTWLHKVLADDWLNRIIEWILKSFILLLLAVFSKVLNWIEYYRLPWFKITVVVFFCIWIFGNHSSPQQIWSGFTGSSDDYTEFAVMGSIFSKKKSEPAEASSELILQSNEMSEDNKRESNGATAVNLTEKSNHEGNHIILYINRFANVAQAEKLKYNIPASIKMAQGILESNAGQSTLAIQNNNHFGIKCMSRKCAKGHCTNHSDDHHKDFFRKYQSAWQGWRAHSELLMSERYRHLQEINPRNYSLWAKGLQEAGYATDPGYAEKLISIIERYQLWQLDLPTDEPI